MILQTARRQVFDYAPDGGGAGFLSSLPTTICLPTGFSPGKILSALLLTDYHRTRLFRGNASDCHTPQRIKHFLYALTRHTAFRGYCRPSVITLDLIAAGPKRRVVVILPDLFRSRM